MDLTEQRLERLSNPQYWNPDHGKAFTGPHNFTLISESIYLVKPPRAHGEADVCGCRAPSTCSDETCANAGLKIECTRGRCPVGGACRNQRLQNQDVAPLEVFVTKLTGLGLRTTQPVSRGSLLIEYVGEIVGVSEFNKRAVRHRGAANSYFMYLEPGKTYVDATFKGNISRFLNHSCEPTAYVEIWTVGEAKRVGVFARADMEAGEAVTFDYQFVRASGEEVQICYCGSATCRGELGIKGKGSGAASAAPSSGAGSDAECELSDSDGDGGGGGGGRGGEAVPLRSLDEAHDLLVELGSATSAATQTAVQRTILATREYRLLVELTGRAALVPLRDWITRALDSPTPTAGTAAVLRLGVRVLRHLPIKFETIQELALTPPIQRAAEREATAAAMLAAATAAAAAAGGGGDPAPPQSQESEQASKGGSEAAHLLAAWEDMAAVWRERAVFLRAPAAAPVGALSVAGAGGSAPAPAVSVAPQTALPRPQQPLVGGPGMQTAGLSRSLSAVARERADDAESGLFTLGPKRSAIAAPAPPQPPPPQPLTAAVPLAAPPPPLPMAGGTEMDAREAARRASEAARVIEEARRQKKVLERKRAAEEAERAARKRKAHEAALGHGDGSGRDAKRQKTSHPASVDPSTGECTAVVRDLVCAELSKYYKEARFESKEDFKALASRLTHEFVDAERKTHTNLGLVYSTDVRALAGRIKKRIEHKFRKLGGAKYAAPVRGGGGGGGGGGAGASAAAGASGAAPMELGEDPTALETFAQ